ncbi:glycosyltransferase family 2 protein [Planctomyces sp. SH-PL62]|uniref:glycosyltransferase family 2 protein n=1 Tax=Planctomyces sp. SH-PL62 TaxID=1636152 RepID=UPI00078DB40F|nr:glycosyltransferase family A protein [Planctomyces sp. SH-PL62]AMV37099.1 Putative glycosyltransferase EpsH [Planctomyces sp. SH-PL62]
MDDVPAGPASAGPGRPSLSVVVPVHNGGVDFERCLLRLRGSTWTDFELLVVDDGSTDDSGLLARRHGAVVLRHDRPLGPAAARNLGAEQATGDLIFFLDADVAVHSDTIERGMARFLEDPDLTALFGSYDDQPLAPGLLSRFRNLLHHYVHQQGDFVRDARPAHTFWTGCGMIRRAAFQEFGGFDPRLYARPSIEDIELGYRLTRAGRRIVLARDVQATHMKRWTLFEVVRTDIFRRGVPWMLLIKRSGTVETDLNVQLGQKLSVAATGGLLLASAAIPLSSWAAPVALAFGVGIAGLNRDLYRFLGHRRGPAFAAGSFPLHLLYFVCCGVSVVIALTRWYALDRTTRPVAEGRIDRGGRPIPSPALGRLARRLQRWTTRSR